MEAAGILVPLGNLGSSGELLDLSAPELSLGGVNPDCIFYQGTSTNGSWRERMLKHLPVKQQDKTRTTKGHGCAERDAVLGVQMAQPQAKRKDNDRQNCTRASCLFGFGFYAQAPTKSPVMPILDADEVPATRKLIPTARELVSPQRHRRVVAQKVVHPLIPDRTFQLGPPTQCAGLVYTNRKDVGACSLVADVLTIVKMYVCAARCKDRCLAPLDPLGR